MNNRLAKSYSFFLIFYSVLLSLYVLAGSHGRLLLQNSDTVKAFLLVVLLVCTAIMNLRIKNEFVKIKRFILLLLNVVVLIVIGCRTATIMIPDEFDIFSTLFFSFQVLGFFLGVLTIIRFLKSK
jgi:hypothetical protein